MESAMTGAQVAAEAIEAFVKARPSMAAAIATQAAAAERERIRRLAVDYDATCQNLAEPSGWGPFATLIERGPDD
jgi:hypothetical protein